MLDTHAVARSLTAADFTPAQADALTDALREFTEQGDHVTPDQFKVGLAEVRTEIANLDTRLSAQIGDVRTEVANLDTRLSTQIAGVHTRDCEPRNQAHPLDGGDRARDGGADVRNPAVPRRAGGVNAGSRTARELERG